MAESMDTSEAATMADEDDRKLFVGGLPQVGGLLVRLVDIFPFFLPKVSADHRALLL